mmetsp:Transcript_29724/g.73964  ORF Transcript_29724/g.73964 Transcript_29724/m.73964 type:complete len:231 (-) Transcript_29724:52-744(-)
MPPGRRAPAAWCRALPSTSTRHGFDTPSRTTPTSLGHRASRQSGCVVRCVPSWRRRWRRAGASWSRSTSSARAARGSSSSRAYSWATSGSECSPYSVWRAIRCACCSSVTSPLTRSILLSTSGSARDLGRRPASTSACMAQLSGCPAPPWATRASPGPTDYWATSPTSTSTPPTTRQSPSSPNGAATAHSSHTMCLPTHGRVSTRSWRCSETLLASTEASLTRTRLSSRR